MVGLLAWLVPGTGHWYLDKPVRAAVLFVVIHVLFWSGVAIGGVFTVNPRQEVWWCRAQMLTGLSGLCSYQRQKVVYAQHQQAVVADLPNTYKSNRAYQQQLALAVQDRLARANLALVPPASGLAYVLTGVAGMLNLMCAFDAVMLALMGRTGEEAGRQEPPVPGSPGGKDRP